MTSPPSPAVRPFRVAATWVRDAARWVIATSRRRRAAFYGAVLAIILGISTGLFTWVLGLLPFKDEFVDEWDAALRENLLGFVLMLVIGIYLDITVHQDDKQESEELQEAIADAVTSAATTGATQAVKELATDIEERLNDQIRAGVAQAVDDVVKSTLDAALEGPLGLMDPEQCVESGLRQVLRTHPESYPQIAEGVLGHSEDCIIDDATIRFTLTSDPATDEYFDVKYELRGVLRRSRYALVLAQGAFNDESRLLDNEFITDTWLFIDAGAYERTLAASSRNEARVRYRNSKSMVLTEDRPLAPAPESDHAQVVFEADLSPPEDSAGPLEVELCAHVSLPSRPLGLRWIFDEPIFVKEIVFDVSGLWPEEEMDFTLYPFILGTEDYTKRSERRQASYRIGINNWLSRGHGVILVWERLGHEPTESTR